MAPKVIPVLYKTHDPARQERSPWYGEGLEDGIRDADLASLCPPGYPMGYQPEKEHSYMYRAGYDRGFQPVPCPCDGSCKAGKQYGEAPEGQKSAAKERDVPPLERGEARGREPGAGNSAGSSQSKGTGEPASPRMAPGNERDYARNGSGSG